MSYILQIRLTKPGAKKCGMLYCEVDGVTVDGQLLEAIDSTSTIGENE